MSGIDVQSQLVDFTTRMIEQGGGMIEWQVDHHEGVAMAPWELAHCLGQHAEAFPVTTEAGGSGGSGLYLGLGSEFVDHAARVLQHFVPAAGAFDIRELSIKKTDYQQAVDAAFGWQNARARVLKGEVLRVAYHTWWFHVVLQSDDAWETLISSTINSRSSLSCPISDMLDTIDCVPTDPTTSPGESTLAAAAQSVEMESLRQADSFLNRAEQRLDRDRKRLRDYYNALLREAATPNRRTKSVPTDVEIASRQRAVKLELQRKLLELDERYAFHATLRPVSLAVFHIPTLVIDLEIQRKSAVRPFQLFWNGLLKRIEPLRCSVCGEGAFNLWFTNDDVEPVCNTCHE